jgi:CRP-like cAMP-binding protein
VEDGLLTNDSNSSRSEPGQSICTDDGRIQRAGCNLCAIRSKMLFADIDLASVNTLLEPISNAIYQPGNLLYRQGESASAVYSLRKGVVKLSMSSRSGDMRIVRLLGPGAAIGLEALLGEAYDHTAELLTPVDVCRIPGSSVQQIAQQQPALYQRLMREWQDHIEQADKHLLALSTGQVKDRVIRLLEILTRLCRSSDIPLLLPTNQDCAALLGARIESVSRVMAELKRKQALQRSDHGHWQFHQKVALDD